MVHHPHGLLLINGHLQRAGICACHICTDCGSGRLDCHLVDTPASLLLRQGAQLVDPGLVHWVERAARWKHVIVTLVMETVTVLLIIAAFTAHFTVTGAMLLLLIFSARRSRVPAAGARSSIRSDELPPRVAPMAGARHLVNVHLVGLVELLVVVRDYHLLVLRRLVVIVELVMVVSLVAVAISREVLFEVRRS